MEVLEAMQKEDSNWRQIGLPMAYHALDAVSVEYREIP
jgi:hypothetical protein